MPLGSISWRFRLKESALDNGPSPISLQKRLDVIFPGMVVVLIEFGKGGRMGLSGGICGHGREMQRGAMSQRELGRSTQSSKIATDEDATLKWSDFSSREQEDLLDQLFWHC